MTMDHSAKERNHLIKTFVHVNDELKRNRQTQWEEMEMAAGMPFPACAACGIRDPHKTAYSRANLTEVSVLKSLHLVTISFF